jgi:DNA-binding LacI/PurR family transcriptional regulator
MPAAMKNIDRDDVARMAGVSSATVSRVFNSPLAVSPDRRERVLAAARALGWSPNKFASALARSSSGSILFVDCAKLSAHDRENADFYAGMYKASLEAILRAVEDSPWHLTIDLDGRARAEGCAGVILFDVDSEAQLEPWLAAGLPLVYGHHTAGFAAAAGGASSAAGRFAVDNRAGGALAARALAAAGRRRPAYVTGKLGEIGAHADRWAGFASAWPEPPSLAQGGLGVAAGRLSLLALAGDIKAGRIDGVGVVNDLTAIGVYQGAVELGLRVPEDLAIIGFDNLPLLDLLPLRLATVDLGLAELYAAAARRLLAVLSGAAPSGPPAPQLPRLVPGGSIPA